MCPSQTVWYAERLYGLNSTRMILSCAVRRITKWPETPFYLPKMADFNGCSQSTESGQMAFFHGTPASIEEK